MPHILILTHKNDSFDTAGYFLHAMAEIWPQQGVKITVFSGPGPRIDADIVFQHIDLTQTPADYLQFLNQYPKVINGKLTDISKRVISDNLVRPSDVYDVPVI